MYCFGICCLARAALLFVDAYSATMTAACDGDDCTGTHDAMMTLSCSTGVTQVCLITYKHASHVNGSVVFGPSSSHGVACRVASG